MDDVHLVALDRDHPGFRDPIYRRRRDAIAHLAGAHQPGDPVPDVAYTDVETEVWRTALSHLAPLHMRYACEVYRESAERVPLSTERIVQLSEVNERLAHSTGFVMEPVAGLVSPRDFMSKLADGIFLATQYIRHHSAPLYTPEPDVIHELVGHAGFLSHGETAALHRRFGEVTSRVDPADTARTDALIRAYWYTFEFGVARRHTGELEAVGAGLLSSYGELGQFETRAELRPFDLDAMAKLPFDPTDYQKVLFVAPNAHELYGELRQWLDELERHA